MKKTMRFVSLIPLALIGSVSSSSSSGYLRSNAQKNGESPSLPQHLQHQLPYETRQDTSASSSSAYQQKQQVHRSLLREEEIKFNYYQCSPNIVEFQSVVFMEFNSDLSNITNTERASLESGFRETYNSLSAALCDEPYHRYIADVTLEWPPKRRRRRRKLQEGESPTTNNQEKSLIDLSYYLPQNATQQQQPNVDGIPSSDQQQSTGTEEPPADEYIVTDVARFLVKVACHDCPANSTLFFEPSLVDNDDSSTSSTATVSAMIPSLSTLASIAEGRSREANFGALGLDDSACGCVKHDVQIADSTHLQQQQPFRAPTSLEFQLAYNQTVGSLNVDGILQGDLDQVEELVEVDVVNCSSNVQRFSSSVVANLQGDAANMSPEERMALERGFLETYNSLTFARCDRFFRQIVEVKLISAQDRRPEDHQRRNMLMEDDFDLLYNGDDDTTSDIGYGKDAFDDIEFYANGTYYGNGTNATWYNTSVTAAPTDSGVVPAVYRVLGECRDCVVSESGSFNLFDDVMLRRALSETQRHPRQTGNDEYHKTSSWLPADTMTSPFDPSAFNSGVLYDHRGRALLEPANVCLCPANTEQVDPTAPTDEEFQEEYSLKVEKLQEEGIVTSVNKVEDVANDEDACEEEFLEEIGVYVITFRDELKGQVSKEDNLEDAFRAAYRALGRGVCGPFLSGVDVIEMIEEKDEDIYQVAYSVGSLQTLPGKVFNEVEVPLPEEDEEAKPKQRKEEEEEEEDEPDIETEEEKFIEAFNQYLGGNRLSAEAIFIGYASTLAPTWAPTTEDMRTKMPVPAVTVPSTNITAEDRQGDGETEKPGVPSDSDGPDANSPTVTPGKEAIQLTQAPAGSKVPTIAPLPTFPTTASPVAAPVVAPTIPVVSAPSMTPVSRPPVTVVPSGVAAPTAPPTKALPFPTLRPTANPTVNNEGTEGAPRAPASPSPTLSPATIKPTSKIGKVVDDVDDFVAEIVEDISDTIETIVGHVVPILDDAKDFFENVESALEELDVTGLPDIPGISDLLEHIDERVEELADSSIPGLPKTTKRIHETILGFLNFLRPPESAPEPSPRPTRAPTAAPTASPTHNPTTAPTLTPGNKDGGDDKDEDKDKDKGKDKGKGKDKSNSEEEVYDEEDTGNGGRQGISIGDSKRTSFWTRIWEWAFSSPTPTSAPPPTGAPISVLPTNRPSSVPPTSAPISVPPSSAPVFTATTEILSISPSLIISSTTSSPTESEKSLPTLSPTIRSTQRIVTSESPTPAHTSTPAALVTSSPTVVRTTGMPTTTATESLIDSGNAQSGAPTDTRTASPTTPVPALEDALTSSPTPAVPSKKPSLSPTLHPSFNQTTEQTSVFPTNPPSREPSTAPTIALTSGPSEAPTSAPTTREPSSAPTLVPTTSEPTHFPSVSPSSEPSAAPSLEPTRPPTAFPTSEPTFTPTLQPTLAPTNAPTGEPTVEPTDEPTQTPTVLPTVAPTTEPTPEPTDEPTSPIEGNP